MDHYFEKIVKEHKLMVFYCTQFQFRYEEEDIITGNTSQYILVFQTFYLERVHVLEGSDVNMQ